MKKPGATPLGHGKQKTSKPRRGGIILRDYSAPSGLNHLVLSSAQGRRSDASRLRFAPGFFITPLRGLLIFQPHPACATPPRSINFEPVIRGQSGRDGSERRGRGRGDGRGVGRALAV